MSENIRTAIHREAASLNAPTPNFESVRKLSVRTSRIRRAVMVVSASILVLTTWGTWHAIRSDTDVIAPVDDGRSPADRSGPTKDDTGWVPAGATGSTSSGGYIFSNVEMYTGGWFAQTNYPTRKLLIRADIGWVDDKYPGRHLCTWKAYDEDGVVIGSASFEFDVQGPGPINHDGLIVEGEPERVEIHCDQERLDSLEGTFIFSDIELSMRTPPAGSLALVLTATYRWDGEGSPSAQDCIATVFEESGKVLARVQQGLSVHDRGPRSISFAVNIPPSLFEEAHSADLECVPLRTG